jgi:hypothetical protein
MTSEEDENPETGGPLHAMESEVTSWMGYGNVSLIFASTSCLGGAATYRVITRHVDSLALWQAIDGLHNRMRRRRAQRKG